MDDPGGSRGYPWASPYKAAPEIYYIHARGSPHPAPPCFPRATLWVDAGWAGACLFLSGATTGPVLRCAGLCRAIRGYLGLSTGSAQGYPCCGAGLCRAVGCVAFFVMVLGLLGWACGYRWAITELTLGYPCAIVRTAPVYSASVQQFARSATGSLRLYIILYLTTQCGWVCRGLAEG